MKQLGEPFCRWICKGLSPLILKKCRQAYSRMSIDCFEGKTLITRKNLLTIVYKFWFRFFSPKPMDVARILTYMLLSETHVLCPTFAVGYGAGAVERDRVDALWRLIIRPAEATKKLVLKAVFGENRLRRALPGHPQASEWRYDGGESAEDSDENTEDTFDDARRKSLALRDLPEVELDDTGSCEYPTGCETNIIVEGSLGAANQLYLETHGYRRDDGEAPDLFAMNVQGMRGTNRTEEFAYMTPDNSHAQQAQAPTSARPPRKRRRRLRKCIDSSSDGDEDLRESESEHEDLRESESEHD